MSPRVAFGIGQHASGTYLVMCCVVWCALAHETLVHFTRDCLLGCVWIGRREWRPSSVPHMRPRRVHVPSRLSFFMHSLCCWWPSSFRFQHGLPKNIQRVELLATRFRGLCHGGELIVRNRSKGCSNKSGETSNCYHTPQCSSCPDSMVQDTAPMCRHAGC